MGDHGTRQRIIVACKQRLARLGLAPEEAQLVGVRLALSEGLKAQRERTGISRQELARRVGSSQSRVSKMEAGDPSVSMDLLVRSMFAAGASKRDVAAVIGGTRRRKAG